MDTSAQQRQNDTTQQSSQGSSGTVSKELETGNISVDTKGLHETGQETPLPPEAVGSGVKIRPTTVTVPPNVKNLGVTPVGQRAPAASTPMPLTDDQIAQGLTQSITSSWRWLAEWCVRKLKQLHRKIIKQ